MGPTYSVSLANRHDDAHHVVATLSGAAVNIAHEDGSKWMTLAVADGDWASSGQLARKQAIPMRRRLIRGVGSSGCGQCM